MTVTHRIFEKLKSISTKMTPAVGVAIFVFIILLMILLFSLMRSKSTLAPTINPPQMVTLERINPIIEARLMVAAEHYAEAANYLGFFKQFDYANSSPIIAQLYDEIAEKRSTWKYRAGKVWQGLIEGDSDEKIGQISGLVRDMSGIGDLSDFSIESYHMLRGEEYDGVLMTLSALGLVASTAQVGSLFATVETVGAASPSLAGSTYVKTGVTTLKAARKAKVLPKWLTNKLINTSKTIGKSIKKHAAKFGQIKTLAQFTNMISSSKDELLELLEKELSTFQETFDHIIILANTRGGLYFLKETKDPESLARVAKFCTLFGDDGIVIHKILGNPDIGNIEQYQTKQGQDAFRRAIIYGNDGIALLNNLGIEQFIHKLDLAEAEHAATALTDHDQYTVKIQLSP